MIIAWVNREVNLGTVTPQAINDESSNKSQCEVLILFLAQSKLIVKGARIPVPVALVFESPKWFVVGWVFYDIHIPPITL